MSTSNKIISALSSSVFYGSLVLVALSFNACEEPQGELYRIEVGKKYYLRDNPDESFIKEVDSLLQTENIQDAKKIEKKVGMVLDLNQQVMDPEALNKMIREGINEASKNSGGTSTEQTEGPRILSAEEKMDRFLSVLNQWSSDAQNAKFYRQVKVKEGQKNLDQLLLANYGSWTKNLPKSVVKFSLQALNRELDLEDLSVGSTVRLPKM